MSGKNNSVVIRVISVPISDFPEELTKAWIGSEVPVLRFLSQAVIKKSYNTRTCRFPKGAYAADPGVAYDVLKQKNPQAYEQLMKVDTYSFANDGVIRFLLFDKNCCEVIK